MTFEEATLKANILTKLYGRYYTALCSANGKWYVTDQFDTRSCGLIFI